MGSYFPLSYWHYSLQQNWVCLKPTMPLYTIRAMPTTVFIIFAVGHFWLTSVQYILHNLRRYWMYLAFSQITDGLISQMQVVLFVVDFPVYWVLCNFWCQCNTFSRSTCLHSHQCTSHAHFLFSTRWLSCSQSQYQRGVVVKCFQSPQLFAHAFEGVHSSASWFTCFRF